VTFDVPNGLEVTRELARREILVDFRPAAGIRVAPHFYTSDDELEQTVEEICQIMAAYAPHRKAR
jgi:kynureninase